MQYLRKNQREMRIKSILEQKQFQLLYEALPREFGVGYGRSEKDRTYLLVEVAVVSTLSTPYMRIQIILCLINY